MAFSFRKSINIGNDNKKKGFLKRFYKEIIVAFIGLLIGTSIGRVGKVSVSLVDEVNSQIENNTKVIESKQNELKTLEDKKLELEESLTN